MNEGKSILDYVEVKEHESIRPPQAGTGLVKPNPIVVVSHCSKCNAPMYGKQLLQEGEVAKVQRTCDCFIPFGMDE